MSNYSTAKVIHGDLTRRMKLSQPRTASPTLPRKHSKMQRRRAFPPMDTYLLRKKAGNHVEMVQQRPLIIGQHHGEVVPPGYPSMSFAKHRGQANSEEPNLQF
ncbi:uncharacterized protein EAF01_003628 [Botrytis porri]|uniref:Uncharacterized protein n=1 Tax=Botrytis porri TaxID=87229 RepID=A0A4Z1KCB3_9HELO|nr:uncharacterized protein EAF01_003628 [Botrytis porri]KAF7909910.1 hypothetical protein EAF01_003628 [Botrytis porri]TGO83270.1 hypothetical protein BPOR_0673g00040 [Botrytis porri]